MPQQLSGIWFKLVEGDGFYLGILMVPVEVARGLSFNSRWRVGRSDGPQMDYALPKATRSIMKDDNPLFETIQCIDFVRADHLMEDAIMVFGISLSDLNRQRGFAFVPSEDYMRRGPALPRKAEVRTENNRFTGLDFGSE